MASSSRCSPAATRCGCTRRLAGIKNSLLGCSDDLDIWKRARARNAARQSPRSPDLWHSVLCGFAPFVGALFVRRGDLLAQPGTEATKSKIDLDMYHVYRFQQTVEHSPAPWNLRLLVLPAVPGQLTALYAYGAGPNEHGGGFRFHHGGHRLVLALPRRGMNQYVRTA